MLGWSALPWQSMTKASQRCTPLKRPKGERWGARSPSRVPTSFDFIIQFHLAVLLLIIVALLRCCARVGFVCVRVVFGASGRRQQWWQHGAELPGSVGGRLPRGRHLPDQTAEQLEVHLRVSRGLRAALALPSPPSLPPFPFPFIAIFILVVDYPGKEQGIGHGASSLRARGRRGRDPGFPRFFSTFPPFLSAGVEGGRGALRLWPL